MDDTKEGGNDKRSWRERLGIGTKDMPKIAEDFKAPSSAKEPELMAVDNGSVKAAPKVQPVTRPAPMAPRAPSRPASGSPLGVSVSATPRSALPPLAATPARPVVAPTPAHVAPPTQVGLTPDALANRLKAQREAAEKLAEQRIQIARQRAEAAAKAEQGARSPVPNGRQPLPPLPVSAPGAKPKFSFAEDESKIAANRPAQIEPTLSRPGNNRSTGIVPQSPVTMAPPRQPLGTERIVTRPQVPPAFTPPPPPDLGYQPGYAGTPGYSHLPSQQAYNAPYRPVDPVTGYGGPMPGSRPSTMPPRQQSSSFGDEVDDKGYSPIPPRPQRAAPMPPRQPTSYGDPDDIFEHPVRSPRRPTAGEYRQAYQEAEMGYDEEQPRSNSRWLLILIPLAALAAAGLGIWFWQSNLRSMQVATPPATTEPAKVEAPVVAAPAEPVKVDPEPAAEAVAPAQTAAPAVAAPTKKQIYDRIVGDNEVPGTATLNPSEVQPVEPAAATPAGQPAAADPAAPAPALQDQGTGESAPLPVPPPPGADGTQGAIDTPPALPGEVVAPAQVTEAASPTATTADKSEAAVPVTELAPEVGATTATQAVDELALAAASADAAGTGIRPAAAEPETAAQIEDILPMPKEKLAEVGSAPAAAQATQPASEPTIARVAEPPPDPVVPKPSSAAATFVDASTQADATDGEASVTVPEEKTATVDAPAVTAPAVTDVTETKPVEAKPKKIAAKQKPAKKVAAKQKALGSEPVVLVAPGGEVTSANSALASSDGIYGELPAAGPSQSNQVAQATTPKRRTLLELFNQQRGTQNARPADQQVASVEPAQPRQKQIAVQEPQPATGGGYVAQLASFRTQDEAQNEYQRLKSRHPQIVGGLTPVINEVTVGGSKRYRLAVGTMQSNAAAGQVCSRLLSAGERDCLVRQR